MKKLVIGIVFCLILSTVVPALATDMQNVSLPTRVEEAGQKLNRMGILLGYPDGLLGLDRNITRAEFVTLVMRMLGFNDIEITVYQKPFSDVENHWAKNMIYLAYVQGLVEGYPDGTFKPERPVSRVEAQAVILRALGYSKAMQGTWPYNVITKATELGLNRDVVGGFNENALRGDIAVLIDNALEIPIMEVIGFDSNGNVRYEVNRNKTLLTEKLGLAKVEGRVDEIDEEENEIVIDDKAYSLKDGAKWLGYEVICYVNKNNEVVFIKEKENNTILYSVIDKIKNGKITLKVNGKEYPLDDDVLLYINGEKKDVNKITAGLYGKVVLKNGRIVLLDLVSFNKSALIVKSVDSKYIKYHDTSEATGKYVVDNYEDVKVYKEGNLLSVEDLKPGDIIYTAERNKILYVYIAPKEAVKGELTRIYSDRIAVDGKTFELGDKVTYSKDDNKSIEVYKKIDDLDNLLGEEVTISFDINGKVRHISAEKAGNGKAIAIVVKKWESDERYVRLYNIQTRKTETYIFTDETVKNSRVDFSELNTKTDAVSGYDVVEFKASGDELKEITVLSQKPERAVTKITPDYITTDKRYYVSEDTIVLKDAVDVSELEVLDWDDISDTDDVMGVKAIVIPDKNTSDAKVIIFTAGIKKLGNAEIFGTVVGKFINSKGKGLEVMTADGLKEANLEAETVYEAVYVGDVISFRFNYDGEIAEVEKINMVNGKVKTVKGGKYVQFEGNDEYYRFADDVVVYDLTKADIDDLKGEDFIDNVTDKDEVDEGQTVLYVLNSDDEIVCLYIVED